MKPTYFLMKRNCDETSGKIISRHANKSPPAASTQIIRVTSASPITSYDLTRCRSIR